MRMSGSLSSPPKPRKTRCSAILRAISGNFPRGPGSISFWSHPAGYRRPLLALLRHFASWSVLLLPCSSEDLRDTLIAAADKSAERHRLAMLSTAIREEAEDLLVRTRNIVGALKNANTPEALGNLVSIADRLSGGTGAGTQARFAPRPGMVAPEPVAPPAPQ